jgi:hypothetical protein
MGFLKMVFWSLFGPFLIWLALVGHVVYQVTVAILTVAILIVAFLTVAILIDSCNFKRNKLLKVVFI